MKNFCLWSRWYDRDQIYHPVWNNKKQTQYMKWQLSRHLTSNIGQWFLRGRKQMRWTLWVSQLITLKDFPGHGTERGKIPFFVFPPFQNSQTEATRVHRTEYQREQRCTENSRDVQRVYLEYSAKHWSALNFQSLRENYEKGLEGTSCYIHIRLRIVPIL